MASTEVHGKNRIASGVYLDWLKLYDHHITNMVQTTIEPSYSDDERDGVFVSRSYNSNSVADIWASTLSERDHARSASSATDNTEGHTFPEVRGLTANERENPASFKENTNNNGQDQEWDEDFDDGPSINTLESLSKGNIRSRDGKTEYTILLVGETGVGKTAFLTFIENAMKARAPPNYVLDVHDLSNESGLDSGQSQTNDAKLYEFTSENGIVLRILDTPGLADTRGTERDDMHKRQIAESIKKTIVSVNAVLVMTNGTNPRLGISTSYALTTLSSIFPRTLADNIGVLCTNVSSALSRNFDMNSLPPSLRSAEDFMIDNPTSLESNLRKRALSNMPPRARAKALKEVAKAHDAALESFALILDWIDERQPQPTNDILSLNEQSMKIEQKLLNTQSQMMQTLRKQEELARFKEELDRVDMDMRSFADFETVIHRDVYELVPTTTPVTACHHTGCHTNCHSPCGVASGVWWWVAPQRCFHCWGHTLNFWVYPACKECGHRHRFHRRSMSKWQTKVDSRTDVDENARDRFNSAKTEKEMKYELIMEIDRNLKTLSKAIEDDMKELAFLAEGYASLSLSGSYASQFEEGVQHMRHMIKTMRADGRDKEIIRVVEENVNRLEKKLAILKDAKNMAQMQVVPAVGGHEGISRRQFPGW